MLHEDKSHAGPAISTQAENDDWSETRLIDIEMFLEMGKLHYVGIHPGSRV